MSHLASVRSFFHIRSWWHTLAPRRASRATYNISSPLSRVSSQQTLLPHCSTSSMATAGKSVRCLVGTIVQHVRSDSSACGRHVRNDHISLGLKLSVRQPEGATLEQAKEKMDEDRRRGWAASVRLVDRLNERIPGTAAAGWRRRRKAAATPGPRGEEMVCEVSVPLAQLMDKKWEAMLRSFARGRQNACHETDAHTCRLLSGLAAHLMARPIEGFDTAAAFTLDGKQCVSPFLDEKGWVPGKFPRRKARPAS